MQTVRQVQNINLQNWMDLKGDNNDKVVKKKIRTFYSSSKYKYKFSRENKEYKDYLNKKYWVAIQLEKLDDDLLRLFDVIITLVASNDEKEVYQVNKSNNMTVGQLALLCDENNLKYGYSFIKEGNYIVINKGNSEYDNIWNKENFIKDIGKDIAFNGI